MSVAPSLAVSEQQAAALRLLHWLEVVDATDGGGLIVRFEDGTLRVLSRAGLFSRYRGRA